MEKNKPTNETLNQPYKGTAPKWAAFSTATAYTAVVLPVLWLTNGVMNLGFDRLIDKIPLKQDVWKRFKTFDVVPTAFVGGFIVWKAYKEGKAAFTQATDAEKQFNKLSIEHDLYREQLTQAGIKPKDVKLVREVDLRTLKLEDKPAASHVDKVEAQKAAAADTAHAK